MRKFGLISVLMLLCSCTLDSPYFEDLVGHQIEDSGIVTFSVVATDIVGPKIQSRKDGITDLFFTDLHTGKEIRLRKYSDIIGSSGPLLAKRIPTGSYVLTRIESSLGDWRGLKKFNAKGKWWVFHIKKDQQIYLGNFIVPLRKELGGFGLTDNFTDAAKFFSGKPEFRNLEKKMLRLIDNPIKKIKPLKQEVVLKG